MSCSRSWDRSPVVPGSSPRGDPYSGIPQLRSPSLVPLAQEVTPVPKPYHTPKSERDEVVGSLTETEGLAEVLVEDDEDTTEEDPSVP